MARPARVTRRLSALSRLLLIRRCAPALTVG
jgi:hypothetical protein